MKSSREMYLENFVLHGCLDVDFQLRTSRNIRVDNLPEVGEIAFNRALFGVGDVLFHLQQFT